MRLATSGIVRDYLERTRFSLRALNKRGLLSKENTKKWARDLLSSQVTQHRSAVLGIGEPTPVSLEDSTIVRSRSALGILVESSAMARLVPVPGSKTGALRQEPVVIEGLPVTACLSHRPDYDYERSKYFPCAGARSWLITPSKIAEYSSSETLQKEIIRILGLIQTAEMNGAEFAEIANALDKAAAPMIL